MTGLFQEALWSLGDLHETLGVREPSSSTVVEGRSFQILQSPLPGSRIDDANAAKPFHHRVSFAERSQSDSLHPSKSSIMLKTGRHQHIVSPPWQGLHRFLRPELTNRRLSIASNRIGPAGRYRRRTTAPRSLYSGSPRLPLHGSHLQHNTNRLCLSVRPRLPPYL